MKEYKLICGYPQNDNITEEVAALQSQNAELLDTLKKAIKDIERTGYVSVPTCIVIEDAIRNA